MPDYKLPSVIYSQEYLPKNENMLNMKYYYIPDNSTLIAQENIIYKDIISNHVFEFFANSFLLECSPEGKVGEVIFASISNKRQPEYRIGTRFTAEKKVEKFSLHSEIGKRHINQILQNEEKLMQRGLKVWNSILKDEKLVTEYTDASTCEDALIKACRRGDKEFIYTVFERLYQAILQSSEYASWQDNILYSFYPDLQKDEKNLAQY